MARDVVRSEARGLLRLAERLDTQFCRALDLLIDCTGSVIVTGMGKAGLVGQKISATLASTGTHSHFLHPGEAIHGDLGRIHQDDAVLALSMSGQTEEVVRLLPSLQAFGVPVVAVTGNPTSPLARGAAITVNLGPIEEACTLGLAPSTSTTAMLAVGDALALVVSRMRQFGPLDFARFHPGGSLGRKLARVEDVMRPLESCRVAAHGRTVREVLVEVGRPGRRTGAVMLTDTAGVLTGIFTDSDLARLVERQRDGALDEPIRNVMTRSPAAVRTGSLVAEAVQVLVQRKISELPVMDPRGRPVGLIDITDMVGLFPHDESTWGDHPAQTPSAPADVSAEPGGTSPPTVPFPTLPQETPHP
jgi:arabinose-5-phosphate isomerase